MDDATVEILLRIREQGQMAFAEASAGLERVRAAINKLRDAQLEGLPVDDATKRALGDLMDRGMMAGVSFDVLKNQIQDARQALTHYSEAVLAGMPEDAAQAAVLLDLTLLYKEGTDAVNDQKTALEKLTLQRGQATTFGAAMTAEELAYANSQLASAGATNANAFAAIGAAGGFAVMAGMILLVVTAIQVLLPPVYLLIAALAVVTSFAVAGAGMLALLGAIGTAIGGLGAITLLLGTQGMGGTASSPWTKFKNEAGAAIDKLREQAEPLTLEILKWAEKGIPAVEKLASSLMRWFGDRIPGILRQISKIIKDLTPDFQSFGKFLGDLFDRNEGKIAPMAEAFIRFGLSLTTGLLKTLEQLSNWFLQRLPTYGPVVQSILGGAGKIVLGLVGAFGRFADYVVKNWPTWVKQITDAWNTKDAKDIRDKLPGEIDSLRQSFEDIIKQAPVWVPQVLALANAMVAIAAAVASITSNLEKLVGFVNGNPIAKAILTGGASLIPSIPGGDARNITTGGRGSPGAPKGGRQAPIVIHVNGAKSPQATALAVALQLRRITQV